MAETIQRGAKGRAEPKNPASPRDGSTGAAALASSADGLEDRGDEEGQKAIVSRSFEAELASEVSALLRPAPRASRRRRARRRR